MPAGSGWFSVLSDKPKVPKFERVDFGKESADLLAENQKNLPAASEFASQFNKISGDQMNAALERMLPGYASMRDKITGNLSSYLRGEIPTDVQKGIERRSAERGISTGTSGSQFDEFRELRNLGITSLELQQQGMSAASRWMESLASRTPVFNIASSFVPIDQRVGIKAAENQFKFQRDWMANKIHAIPWGWKAVMGNASNAATDDAHQFGQMMAGYGASSMMGGGGMGGGGGGGGMGGASNPADGSTQPNTNALFADYGEVKQTQSANNYGYGSQWY